MTRFPVAPPKRPSTPTEDLLNAGKIALGIGIGCILFAMALTIRCYMPCPFWDEWRVLSEIAGGARPWNPNWLFSFHNEHRIAIPRLLIWTDLMYFGARNVSLFVEMYLAQLAQLGAVCWLIARSNELSPQLRMILGGAFCFCLFHPNQAENLNWAFQIGFVFPFAITTVALVFIVTFDSVPSQFRKAGIVFLAISPAVAAFNLAAGLLLAPTLLGVALIRRFPKRVTLALAGVYAFTWGAYLTHGDAAHAVFKLEPRVMISYFLNLFDSSWRPFIPTGWHIASLLSLVLLMALSVSAIRRGDRLSLLCLGECVFVLLFAAATTIGRARFGPDQAFAGRYQTPVMVYWGSIFSLVLLCFSEKWQRLAGVAVVAAMAFSLVFYPFYWKARVQYSDTLRNACDASRTGDYSKAQLLYPEHSIDIVRQVNRFLLDRQR